jgi:hypothetical protein
VVSVALSIDGSSPAGSTGGKRRKKKKEIRIRSVYCSMMKEPSGNGNNHN